MARTEPWYALKLPPPVILAAFAFGVYGLARGLPAGNWPFAGHRVLAMLLAGGGVAVALAGVAAFRRARTTVHPHHPEKTRTVVVTGIYRFSRNPMYLGMALVLAGCALWWATLAGLVLVPLFAATLTRLQIVPEERALEAKFGAGYAAYRARVGRWFGRAGRVSAMRRNGRC